MLYKVYIPLQALFTTCLTPLLAQLTLLQNFILLFPIVHHLLQRFTSVHLEGIGPGAAEDIFKYK